MSIDPRVVKILSDALDKHEISIGVRRLHEPVIDGGQTVDNILVRLKTLEKKLEAEGLYGSCHTCILAQEAIRELRKHQWTYDQVEQAPQPERSADQDRENEIGC